MDTASHDFLRGRRFLTLDGSMGALLLSRGFKGSDIYSLNVSRPDVIRDIHLEYFNAGARMILTNTFCVTRKAVDSSGAPLGAIIEGALGAALEARGQAGADRLVALNMGPCPEAVGRFGGGDPEMYERYYRDRLKYAGDADLVFYETFADPDELVYAVGLARECAKPVYACFSFTSESRTWYGADIASSVEKLIAAGPDAVGMNCTLDPAGMRPVLREFAQAVAGRKPVIAEPNRGLPLPFGTYAMPAGQFAEETLLLAGEGAVILGGCCGSDPECVRLLREGLDRL